MIYRRPRRALLGEKVILAAALFPVLAKLDLEVAEPGCRNFLSDGAHRESDLEQEDKMSNLKRKLKERNMQRMRQDLDRIRAKGLGESGGQRPFCWTYGFKSLRVIVACN